MNNIKWKLYSGGSTCETFYGVGKYEIIKKKYRKTFLYKGGGTIDCAFNNEVSILKKVNGIKHFPKIIEIDYPNQIIYMTYCGKEMYQGNMPKNCLVQINEILDSLEQCGISYNDFKSQHLRVFQGSIYLIDFGASEIKNKIYKRINSIINIKSFSH
jgi:tRNA A-37 threonylcarbamoyl transferase component Bud32